MCQSISMSYYSSRSESKLDHDDDDDDHVVDVADGLTTASTTTPGTVNRSPYESPYHQHMRSTTATTTPAIDRHYIQQQFRRSRYIDRLHHRVDSTPSTTTTPTSAMYEATADTSTSARYRVRRPISTSSSLSRERDLHSQLMEESSTSFVELIRQHRQREFNVDANDAGAEDEEEDDDDEEEYEDEEVDDYDDEEEEEDDMDDGSTAVTIRAPTDRRSSTPIWSASGMASHTGSSSDMGTTDIPDIGITTQTSTVTTTSVAPINNDGTDQDELLVGSGSSADGGDTTIAASSTNTTSMVIAAVPNLHSLFEKPYLREIGIEDILSFELSSAKPGNGVEQLYDPSFETYWQSDGISQPHWIQIQLPRRLPVTHVALYLDYQLDESYTPRTVQIETGLTVVQDSSSLSHHATILGDAPIMELHEPVGWCIFPIYIPPDPFDTDHGSGSGIIINETTMIPRAHWVRISILSMHQNGRDTHIRRVALFCQRTSMTVRMPPQPHISNKLTCTDETKQVAKLSASEADGDDAHNDHEEILLYARTRSTVRNYDPAMLPQSNMRVNHQPSLFGTIR